MYNIDRKEMMGRIYKMQVTLFYILVLNMDQDLTLEVLDVRMKRKNIIGKRTTIIITVFKPQGNTAFLSFCCWTAVFNIHLQSKWHEMIS